MPAPISLQTDRPHQPDGSNAVLNARSLAADHRRLAEMVRPGMSILDVGCGTGAITRGVADAVQPGGRVVGLDSHAGLIAEARERHAGVPGLSFEVGDVYDLSHRDAFDIVSAARVLQWLPAPERALAAMAAATRPGGNVLVLDYDHERVAWTPEPPESMRRFYAAFLRWRADAGMDNRIAGRLGRMLREAGLEEVREWPQHETTRRGDADFATRIGIWAQVARLRGPAMVEDGFLTEAERGAAESDYRSWTDREAQSQTLHLVAVEGQRPPL
jgi:ubiquinone/menaquinone biosynthesis C-methylase UbiE